MIKQRRESIALYEQGNRAELAQQERDEIGVIESFLPQQMTEDQIAAAAQAAIAETGAAGIKDMGKVMATLREHHAGVDGFQPRGADRQTAAGLGAVDCEELRGDEAISPARRLNQDEIASLRSQ